MLEQAVCVFNGKGGVGKTSLTANVAGLLVAEAGWKVLVVDLDVQGDIAADLGYAQVEHPGDDGGNALLQAIVTGEPIQTVPIADQHGIDVIPGGGSLAELRNLLGGQFDDADRAAYAFHGAQMHKALGKLAPDYDLILFDCPPEKRNPLTYEAMGCSRWVLSPTKADMASTDALSFVAQEMAVVHQSNPVLEVLAVVLFGVPSNATRLQESALTEIRAVADGAGWGDVVAPATIRASDKTAYDTRMLGILAHHYASRADETPAFIPDPAGGDKRIPNPTRVSGAAGGLIEDYISVVQFIAGRMAAGS